MKKIISFVLWTVFCLSLVTFAATEVSEVDMTDVLDLIDDTLDDINDEDEVDEDELLQAIILLHSHEITKFDTVETFMPDNNIRRDEIAKMDVYFRENVLENITTIVEDECSFKDLDQAHSDLPDLICRSYNYGLFKGYEWNFMPTDSITNGQAVIVLIRMIDGFKDETSVAHYAQNYMDTAEELGLLDGLGISNKSEWDKPALRSTVSRKIIAYIFSSKNFSNSSSDGIGSIINFVTLISILFLFKYP